jgi:multidrug efflux pump
MARFFIDRPVFAWVVAILIMLFGVLSITQLPVSQYPDISPPSVNVSANYSGASAEVVQNTVTSVIEQNLTGIDNLIYITSSSSDGSANITLTFEPGTDPDMAAVQVQNKVQLTTSQLPKTVQQQGISVTKRSGSFILIVSLSSDDGSMNEYDLGNYISANLLDQIRRVTGVGDAMVFGTEYAMRVWLDPEKLNSYSLMPSDVEDAITAQNTNVSIGKIGDAPSPKGQQLNVTLKGQTTLKTAEQFGNILLRVNKNGSRVLLKDVARVELGGQGYTFRSFVNGDHSASIAIKPAPDANVMSTVKAVRAKVAQLQQFFPNGISVSYPVDASQYVRISIIEVVKTLVEAVGLVFLVMYLFLQRFRATLIPTIVVPVALLGSFAAMYAFGFSINMLTMFGLVLAIGILVDDAIVVVENVERIMSEEGLPAREATIKAMSQIQNALVAITLVLTAVFIPMAFFSGSVGIIYRQFSLSLISSMLCSLVLALSLTPALCTVLLPKVEKGHKMKKGGFFGWFNRWFAASSKDYQSGVARVLVHAGRFMLIYLAIAAVTVFLYKRLPTSFLPEEDQGRFMVMVQLPSGATQERTVEVLDEINAYFKKQPEVMSTMAAAGFSSSGQGQNVAMCFVKLKDWSERKGSGHSVQSVISRSSAGLSKIKDAQIFPMNEPLVHGLGEASGFDMELQDLGGLGHDQLMAAKDKLIEMAAKDPRLSGVHMQGLEDESQMKVDVDYAKAEALGLDPSDINDTLSTAFGSSYVNNFVNGNRVQRVIVQMDAPFRSSPDDVMKLYVRNDSGTMVQLSSIAKVSWSSGNPSLKRYNGFSAVEIVGSAPQGKSTGDAMNAVAELVKKLPQGIGYEWTASSYQEKLSGSQAPLLYALSIFVVFLCLAALYESWSIPIAVLLVVPLGIFGAVLLTEFRGLENDVFFKVGFLTIIGLSAKNSILIVEFAKDAEARGLSLLEATLEAVHLRLRPILMTSFAFILGVMPMALASGAGSASQNAIGTGVVGGMIAATFLAIFLVPVFFVLVRRGVLWIRGKVGKNEKAVDHA